MKSLLVIVLAAGALSFVHAISGQTGETAGNTVAAASDAKNTGKGCAACPQKASIDRSAVLESASAQETVERAETSACVQRCLDYLPDSYRSVILLYEAHGLRAAEIAELLGGQRRHCQDPAPSCPAQAAGGDGDRLHGVGEEQRSAEL